MAVGLARSGARVAVLGRTRATLEHTVRLIGEAGGDGVALTADVLDSAGLEAANSGGRSKSRSVRFMPAPAIFLIGP